MDKQEKVVDFSSSQGYKGFHVLRTNQMITKDNAIKKIENLLLLVVPEEYCPIVIDDWQLKRSLVGYFFISRKNTLIRMIFSICFWVMHHIQLIDLMGLYMKQGQLMKLSIILINTRKNFRPCLVHTAYLTTTGDEVQIPFLLPKSPIIAKYKIPSEPFNLYHSLLICAWDNLTVKRLAILNVVSCPHYGHQYFQQISSDF